ncbi:hypothetical protein PV325_008105 [Microctonus aethiopoides]|nr:hypothetical protein PV325_008105 [Microctonus aethiopoides]KAK0075603.1 hypothetical protein PV326_011439 [Microctonus aethiopoides]
MASSSNCSVSSKCNCQCRTINDTTCETKKSSDFNGVGCHVKNYRPHGNLARLLWEKQRADERLEAYDKSLV